MSSWLDDFTGWLSQPFSADMDTKHWFMFIGLMLLMLTLWGIILSHIRAAAQ